MYHFLQAKACVAGRQGGPATATFLSRATMKFAKVCPCLDLLLVTQNLSEKIPTSIQAKLTKSKAIEQRHHAGIVTTSFTMPNIHGLSSLRNDNPRRPPNDSDSDNDENNRYVGGVSSRGGGSGLAVLPNHQNNNGDAASDSIFNLAEAGDAQGSSSSSGGEGGGGEVRRMITMYRSGFTVDNGLSCDVILKGKGSYEENHD